MNFRYLDISKMTTPANRVIDIESDNLTVITSELDLLRSGKFADFLIICQEEQFICHKMILKKKSDVLLRMLEANMLESKTGVLREGFKKTFKHIGVFQ